MTTADYDCKIHYTSNSIQLAILYPLNFFARHPVWFRILYTFQNHVAGCYLHPHTQLHQILRKQSIKKISRNGKRYEYHLVCLHTRTRLRFLFAGKGKRKSNFLQKNKVFPLSSPAHTLDIKHGHYVRGNCILTLPRRPFAAFYVASGKPH